MPATSIRNDLEADVFVLSFKRQYNRSGTINQNDLEVTMFTQRLTLPGSQHLDLLCFLVERLDHNVALPELLPLCFSEFVPQLRHPWPVDWHIILNCGRGSMWHASKTMSQGNSAHDKNQE
jgi:hypothetical protein